jgi:hypothetical protein
MSEAEQEQPPQNITFPMDNYCPPTNRIIDGPLPKGRWLAHPLTVLIEYDDGEVVVSEPHFHMHAAAPTEAEAIAAFRRVFSGYLDVLASREEKLGTQLREQLQYLRSAIRSA